MPSNRARIDADLVKPTQYNIRPDRKAKDPPPKPWPLPEFKPLHINNFDDHGTPKLPPNVNPHDPFELFSQFFTDNIMDKLVA